MSKIRVTDESNLIRQQEDQTKEILYGESNPNLYENEASDNTRLASAQKQKPLSGMKKFLKILITKNVAKKMKLKLKRSQSNSKSQYLESLIISYSSIWKASFDAFMDTLVVYNIVTTLFFLAFQEPNEVFLTIDEISRALFIVDIILTFFVEIKDSRNNSIRSLPKIGKRYLKTYFVVDVVAVMPFRYIGIPKVEYIIRLTRRICKLPGIFDILDGGGMSFIVSWIAFGKSKDNDIVVSLTHRYYCTILQLCLKLAFFVYFLGCVWWWFQNLVKNYEYSSDTYFAKEFDLENSSFNRQVTAACYFMLTTLTTVGYGDLRPTNTYEEAFSIFILLLGVVFFAYIMGSFNSVISDYDGKVSAESSLSELNVWVKSLENLHGELPEELKQSIFSHYVYYFNQDRNKGLRKSYWIYENPEDMVKVDQMYLRNLPPKTVKSIFKYLYDDLFHAFSLFLGSTDLKFDLVPHLQPRMFESGEFILNEGELAYELIFLLDGQVTCGPVVNGKLFPVMNFTHGRTVLGDYSCLTKMPMVTSFLANTSVKAFVVPRKPFLDILDYFYPDEKTRILKLASSRYFHIKELAEYKKKTMPEWFENENGSSDNFRNVQRYETSIGLQLKKNFDIQKCADEGSEMLKKIQDNIYNMRSSIDECTKIRDSLVADIN